MVGRIAEGEKFLKQRISVWCTGVASRAVRARSIKTSLMAERLKIMDLWVLAVAFVK